MNDYEADRAIIAAALREGSDWYVEEHLEQETFLEAVDVRFIAHFNPEYVAGLVEKLERTRKRLFGAGICADCGNRMPCECNAALNPTEANEVICCTDCVCTRRGQHVKWCPNAD